MKKWILVLGIVLIVVGAAFYVYNSSEKASITDTSFTQSGTEYISKNISANKDYIISVTNPTSHSGLVKSGDVSLIKNDSALSKYSLTTYTSFGNIKEYRNLSKGGYVFVEFSSSKIATSITYGETGRLVVIGYIGDFATFFLVIGGIVAIAGVLLGSNFKLSKF